MNLALLKPENFCIRLVQATKRSTKESYEHGCDPDDCRETPRSIGVRPFPSVLAAMRHCVGDDEIRKEQVGTIDPNIYRDKKGGGVLVVENRTAKGIFRATYDRQENEDEVPPTPEQEEKFKKGEMDLWLADYEIHFQINVVGLDEKTLAEVTGVSNWS